jgi:predicted acylesterase/phospholipase RssA
MTTPNAGPAAMSADGAVRKSREIRVGLVMYGGVSLTTYTNGVAREFHDAVRGRGVYALVKALTDSDFVVDVMSGTSAGGINGVLLSYCLANGYEFGQFEQLWRERGSLLDLVVPAGNLEGTHSLLDGDYFLGQLREALDRAKAPRDPSRSSGASLDAEPSVISEIDLFVTATDARGRIYTWFDDAGHAVDVKDHRAVFKLKYRADRYADAASAGTPRYTDFGPDDSDALAKLARSTASFPVAFAPSRVEDSPVDATLRKWGNLHPTDMIDFLDGGVLDNKPFTYTLDAIFFRHADRDVKRVLFYIEPDPERLAEGDDAWRRLKSHPPVTAFEAAVKGLSGIPAYESIAEDLRMLTRHNESVTRRKKIHEMLTSADVLACPPMIAKLHRRLRLAMLSERVLHGLLTEGGHDRLFADPAERRAIAAMAQGFWDYFDDDVPLSKTVLRHYDIYYRLRRIFHLLYQPDAEDRAQPWYRALVALVDLHEIVRWGMESVIDACTASLFDSSNAGDGAVVRQPGELWLEAQAVLDHFLRTVHPGVARARAAVLDSIGRADGAAALGACVKDVREQVKAVMADAGRADFIGRVRAASAPVDGAPRHALAELDAALRGVLRAALAGGRPESVRRLKDAHRAFRCLDALELVEAGHSRLPSRDVIRTVRLSPYDAFARSCGYSHAVKPADKIAGDSLFHFGGFLKRAWRSNDIMWGRIDGSAQLLADFADEGGERVAQVLADDRTRQRLADRITAIGGALQPGRLFAQGTWDDLSVGAGGPALESWLTDLLSDNADVRAGAVARWNDGLKLLALAHHRTIAAGSAETVLLDQLAEEMEWGGRVGSRLWRWFRGVGGDASLPVKLMHARQVVRGDLEDMGLRPETDVGSPFQWRVERVDRLDTAIADRLNVGSQPVAQALTTGVKTKLASRITRAALHAFSNSAGGAARRVRSHPVFLWSDRVCRAAPVLVSRGVLGTLLRGSLSVFVAMALVLVLFGEPTPGFTSGAITATVVLLALSILVRFVPRGLFVVALPLVLLGMSWIALCAVGCPWDAVCAPLKDVPAHALSAVRRQLDAIAVAQKPIVPPTASPGTAGR